MPKQIIEFSRPLILATTSPARRKLVAETGISFRACSVDIDESPLSDERPAAYVERVAKAKALAVGAKKKGAVIVAVDTTIGLGRKIIGKPRDKKHAREILAALSGRTHKVLSSIALRDTSSGMTHVETTRTEVDFVNLTDGIIDWYISTGEWKNRAGAYAIQAKGSALVKEIRGCLTNVIGISIPSLLKILKAIRR